MKRLQKNILRNRKFFPISIILIAFVAVSCGRSPLSPVKPSRSKAHHVPSGKTFGLVAVTISGIGSHNMQATARPYTGGLPQVASASSGTGLSNVDNSDGSGDGTIQMKAISTSSFTVGKHGHGGYRYIRAVFRVRNAQKNGQSYDQPRQNLTFLAVDTDGPNGTIGVTPFSKISLFNGHPADPRLTKDFVPAGAVQLARDGTVQSQYPDVLQIYTESEAGKVLKSLPSSTIVNTVFPYGFVVRSPDITPHSRELPASPDPGEYNGVVTFSFKVPLQVTASEAPYEITMMYLPVDDSRLRITQSPQEQNSSAATAALQKRAADLAAGGGPLTVTLLGNSTTIISGYSVRRICQVRVAGTANDPEAYLGNTGTGCSASSMLPSNVRVVKKGATGTGTGKSWANAFPTLQAALNCVRAETGSGQPCEGVNELWVAKGVYYPDVGPGVTANDPNATFSLVEGVKMYGGFLGVPSEYRLSQRNPETNVTILSGDITQNDINTDGNFIDETYKDYVLGAPNSNHVVTADGADGTPITSATVLDGFTITAAYSTAKKKGGALLCNGSGAGGECSPTLHRLVFSGNIADYHGGAALRLLAGKGGKASPLIRDITFKSNGSSNQGGAVYIAAGSGGTAKPVFIHVWFRNNYDSGPLGGAVFMTGDTDPATTVQAKFYNCRFTGNSAGSGGAIYSIFGSLTVVNSLFRGNSADTEGGAIYLHTISKATAASLQLINDTFVGNSAGSKSSGVIGGNLGGYVPVVLHNVIAWDNTPQAFSGSVSAGADPFKISNSIIQGGCPSGAVCTKVKKLNPQFINAANGNLHLQGSSPAIGLGSNSFLPTDTYDLDGDGNTGEKLPVDLDGNPRVVHRTVDAGAYEKQ